MLFLGVFFYELTNNISDLNNNVNTFFPKLPMYFKVSFNGINNGLSYMSTDNCKCLGKLSSINAVQLPLYQCDILYGLILEISQVLKYLKMFIGM